jgi:creatinine amidohydrolase
VSHSNPEIEGLYDAEIAALLPQRPLLLLPVGAVESHGDHLPAGTDNILARRLTSLLARRLAGIVPSITLPLLSFGQVWSLGDAPGSFSLSAETVARILIDLGLSAGAKGLATMIVVNAHYGNVAAIRDAQRALKERDFTLALFNYPGARAATEQVRQRPAAHPAFMHACEIETSYMLHLAPEHVRMDQAIENYPAFPPDFDEVAYRWSEFSLSPVLGDARAATAEKGKFILDHVVAEMARLAADLYARQSGPNRGSQP